MRRYFKKTHQQLSLLQEVVFFLAQSKLLIVLALLGVVTSIFWSPGLLAGISASLPAWLLAITLFPLVVCMVAVMIFAGTGLLAVLLTAFFELILIPAGLLFRKSGEAASP